MQIPKETIDIIRERCRIEDIVQRYVPSLKKKGRNYVGLCPFHKEKTPSFTVTPEKQIFYCFGCHTGGNIFSFIQKIERVDFPQSVKIAGDLVGIEVVTEDSSDTDGIAEMARINSYAMRVYQKLLTSSAGADGLNYLKNRGLTDKSIEEFRLGFAPDSWSFLTDKLKQKRASMELAEKCGLVGTSKKKEGHYFDSFRGRVMFPILDVNDRVIAFGGRVINNDHPKYINTQETPLFKKRNVLYGMNRARAHISDVNRAIVVEGYLDVIGCHQQEIQNVVAPLGTALTEQQIKYLSRYCEEIILLFDADSAGINAALKSLAVAGEVSVDIRIATLPEDDPFDFIQKKGDREFMAVVDRALNPVDFQIERVMANKKKNGPVKTLIMLFDIIESIELESRRSIYLKNISSLVGIDENSVRKDFARYIDKRTVPESVQANEGKTENTDFLTRSYRSLIALLCNYPGLASKVSMDFSINEIRDEASRNILVKMVDMYREEGVLTVNKLFDFFQGGLELNILNRSLNRDYVVENPDSAYEEIYLNMKLYEINGKIDKYADLIKRTPGNRQEYLTEIEILRRDKEKLSQYIYNRGRH